MFFNNNFPRKAGNKQVVEIPQESSKPHFSEDQSLEMEKIPSFPGPRPVFLVLPQLITNYLLKIRPILTVQTVYDLI